MSGVAAVGVVVTPDTWSVTADDNDMVVQGSRVIDAESSSRTPRRRSAARSFSSASTTDASAANARSSARCALCSVRLHTRPHSRDAPKFGLGRKSAEYSAEGFGSVRFGHASTFRTSVLFSLSFAPRSAHFIACVQSLYSKN